MFQSVPIRLIMMLLRGKVNSRPIIIMNKSLFPGGLDLTFTRWQGFQKLNTINIVTLPVGFKVNM